MARWKPLPDGLDPLVVQFVAELRKLKDDSGLRLSRLAKKTGFSASSWERYLGGRAFPPERVVRALATVVPVDDTDLLVLHQMAQQAWIRSGPTPAVRINRLRSMVTSVARCRCPMKRARTPDCAATLWSGHGKPARRTGPDAPAVARLPHARDGMVVDLWFPAGV